LIKKWLLSFTFALSTLTLAACGSAAGGGNATGADSGGSAKENAAAVVATKSKDPVHLVFYSTAAWSQDAFNERFGDAIRKKFPNYDVEAVFNGKGTTVEDLIGAGTTIDIYWQDVNGTIPELLQYGMQYDMSGLIKQFKLDLATLDPTSIAAIKDMSGGKMYALPLVNNTAVLYYNKDLFDKFAVAYPTDNMTWDQVIELGKKMHRTDGGVQYFGLRSDTQPHANLTSLSIPYIDPKTGKPTILTDDRWKTIFSQLVDIRKTMDNTLPSFVRDPKVAMSEDLANIFLNNAELMSKMNWDMVAYPTFKEAPNVGAQPLPTLFGITSVSKQKYEAMEVLQYMLSKEQQLSLSERAVIPVLQDKDVISAFGKNSTFKGVNFQAVFKRKFAAIPPKTKYEAQIRKIYGNPLSDLTKGAVDLNTAFRQIDEQINQLIAADQTK
jgi:multiple sugar transport system substrate-binding protein